MGVLVRTLGAFLLVASSVRADAVYLEGGRVIEGEASIEGDKVQVLLESGRISFPRAEVLRIESSTSARKEAQQREAALRPSDLPAMLELANFCRDHELRNQERALLERIVESEPDHAEARRRLGFVREGDVWLDRAASSRRAELARQQRRQAELEIEHKVTTLRVAEAKLELAQKESELRSAQAQLARQRTASEPGPHAWAERDSERGALHTPARPFFARAPEGALRHPWMMMPPLLYAGPLPVLTPSGGAPAFPIPGVRHPSDMSFSIPGVRAPSQYFDGAFRR